MQHFENLFPGCFYHIYNHAAGGRNLFLETDNYEYFLFLYDKHISPVADTFAWVYNLPPLGGIGENRMQPALFICIRQCYILLTTLVTLK